MTRWTGFAHWPARNATRISPGRGESGNLSQQNTYRQAHPALPREVLERARGATELWIQMQFDLTLKSIQLHPEVMAVLTIRDVPDDVKEALGRDARERGQSLQSFLLGVLKQQAAFSHNRQLLAEIERDLAEGGGAGDDASDAAELLEQARPDRRGGSTHLHGTDGAA